MSATIVHDHQTNPNTLSGLVGFSLPSVYIRKIILDKQTSYVVQGASSGAPILSTGSPNYRDQLFNKLTPDAPDEDNKTSMTIELEIIEQEDNYNRKSWINEVEIPGTNQTLADFIDIHVIVSGHGDHMAAAKGATVPPSPPYDNNSDQEELLENVYNAIALGNYSKFKRYVEDSNNVANRMLSIKHDSKLGMINNLSLITDSSSEILTSTDSSGRLLYHIPYSTMIENLEDIAPNYCSVFAFCRIRLEGPTGLLNSLGISYDDWALMYQVDADGINQGPGAHEPVYDIGGLITNRLEYYSDDGKKWNGKVHKMPGAANQWMAGTHDEAHGPDPSVPLLNLTPRR